MTKFPLGVQHFPRIINEGFLYIDKTRLIHSLVTGGVAYFLSRPRRFGKSLLISTLEAIFQARKDLFLGLWINSSNYSWEKHPVVRLDFSKTISSSPEKLEASLKQLVIQEATKYGVEIDETPFPSFALSSLVTKLKNKLGKVVILIDEYDKPIVHHLTDMDVVAKNREILRDFFSMIKSIDSDLRFVFVTGVSKFSKVSLFSGMNNLIDISQYDDYAELLGLTETEIRSHLGKEVAALAKKHEEPEEAMYRRLKQWYNGYKFNRSPSSSKVYNPLSVFSCLDTGNFDNYWFSTATPTFAIDLIRKQDFPVEDFDRGVVVGSDIEMYHEAESIALSALLFQTGYLTIDKYDQAERLYHLKFPNEEVRRSFLEHLLKGFVSNQSLDIPSLIFDLKKRLKAVDFKGFFDIFNCLLASAPYQIQIPKEGYYHTMIYLILKVFGFDVQAEVSTSCGRIDMVLKTDEMIFIFEFTLNKDAAVALGQIQDRGYQEQFKLDKRKMVLVGANFNSNLRKIDNWEILEG